MTRGVWASYVQFDQRHGDTGARGSRGTEARRHWAGERRHGGTAVQHLADSNDLNAHTFYKNVSYTTSV